MNGGCRCGTVFKARAAVRKFSKIKGFPGISLLTSSLILDLDSIRSSLPQKCHPPTTAQQVSDTEL